MPERAHTYDVPLDLALPDLSEVSGVARVTEPDEHLLEATYFDTSDHRLAFAGVGVRRQTGGADPAWFLDLPSAEEPGARHVLRLGLGRAVRTVPQRFRSTVMGLTGDQTLSAVATVTTRRAVLLLLDKEDAVLAQVTDDCVEALRTPVAGDAALPQVWREVHVALLGGRRKLLDRVDERLAKAGVGHVVPGSRLADVLGAVPAPPLTSTLPSDAAGQLVQQRLHELVSDLRTRDPVVREGLPEGVHAMRVATRRLRSHLATARPFLDRSVTDPLRDELSWLAEALGGVRDAEVRSERLDESVEHLVEDRPEVNWGPVRVRSALWSPLAAQHRRALAELDEVLTSQRYALALERLRDLVTDPPWTEKAGRSVRRSYRRRTQRQLDRLRERMAAALDADLAPDVRAEALHEARKTAKRARYAIEPLRPVLGKPAAKLVRRLKDLQAILGEHQDAVVTRDYLQTLSQEQGSSLDPAAVLTAGALIERESRAAEQYDARAAAAWSKLEKRLRLG